MKVASCRGEATVSNRSPSIGPVADSSDRRITVYIDGAGQRPDGRGSGYGFVIKRGTSRVKTVDGLTNNQAEYRALLYAVRKLPRHSAVDIFSDSSLVVEQFNGKCAVNDPHLSDLLKDVQFTIRERHLDVQLNWVSRKQNPAGKLMERR
jgi:ribonuclease HI